MEYSNRKRTTRWAELLSIMEEVIPCDEWTAIIEPYYPSGKRGVEAILRIYLLANWFNL